MRSLFLKHQERALRVANLLYIVVLSIFYIAHTKIDETYQHSIGIVLGIAIGILCVLLILSFVSRLKSLYPNAIFYVVWLQTVILLIDAIRLNYDRGLIALTVLGLVISYQTVFDLKRYYQITTVIGIMIISMAIISHGPWQIKLITVVALGFVMLLCYMSIVCNKRVVDSYNKVQSRYKALLANTSEAFALHELIYNEDGKPIDYTVLMINKAYENSTGLKRIDVEGSRIYELIPETEPYWLDSFANVVMNNERCQFINYSVALGKYFKVCAYPAGDNQFVTLFTDVTDKLMNDRDRNQAVRNAQKANDFKSQFLKDVNHRLRTPLNGMLGMSQIIDRDSLSSENLEIVDAMISEMNRSRNILNQIAEYVKIGDIEHVITKNDIILEINNVIDQVEAMYQTPIKLINSADLDDGNKIENEIYYESQVFKGVLDALLVNACQHSNSDTIEIVLEGCKNQSNMTQYYKVLVVDHGIGIKEAHQSYIFNELHHHNFVELNREEGHMSLSLSKQLMTQIGGDLMLTSEVGKGTELTILLPVFDKIGK